MGLIPQCRLGSWRVFSGLSFCYLTNGLEADQVKAFMRSSSVSTLAGRLLLESDA